METCAGVRALGAGMSGLGCTPATAAMLLDARYWMHSRSAFAPGLGAPCCGTRVLRPARQAA